MSTVLAFTRVSEQRQIAETDPQIAAAMDRGRRMIERSLAGLLVGDELDRALLLGAAERLIEAVQRSEQR